MMKFVRQFFLVFFCALGSVITFSQDRPNIIYIMVDDMGYADLSCYGNTRISTPHIDELAKRGIRFTQAYAPAPVCTPSRTAFMTGAYPARTPVGLREPLDWIREDSTVGLDGSIISLPVRLKNAGYETHLVGKWHLGFAKAFFPLKNGFDSFYGSLGGGVDYISHTDPFGNPDFYDGDHICTDTGYMTDLLAQRAADIIRMDHKTPFFLSLQMTAPHWPWQGPGDPVYPLGDGSWKENGSKEVYRRMVERLDSAVGVVMKTLQETSLEKKTIVVFTSDNGGERFSDMGGLKKSKMTLWEGGIRVPAIVCWPGKIEAGSVSGLPVIHMDWTATFLSMAGAPNFPVADGVNLLPYLEGKAKRFSRTFYWRTYQRTRQKAIRDGDWKYLQTEEGEYLFNLAKDPFETSDLSKREPAKLAELKHKYSLWEKTVLIPVPLPGK